MRTERAAPIPLMLLIILFLAASCENLSSDEAGSSSQTADSTIMMVQIDADGFYSIELDQLEPAGLEINDYIRSDFHLSHAGAPVPYYLIDSALIFYGRAPDSRYSTHRTYWLQLGEPGELMDQSTLLPEDLPAISNIRRSLHFEENLLYDGAASSAFGLDGQDFEPWFWETIQVASTVEIEIELPNEPQGSAELSLGVWGVTENNLVDADHDLDIFVNGEFVAQINWDGQSYFSNTLSLPNALLQRGDNTIELDNSGGGAASIDISRLDWIELSYLAKPVADKDQLHIFDVQGKVRASGFSGRPMVFDISNKYEPIILSGWEYDSGSVTLPVSKGMDLFVVGPDGLLEPGDMEFVAESDLRSDTNQADLIILTTDDFVSPLQPLIAAREAQSLNVRLVTLDEIYENFGSGQNGPDSISDFIQYAFNNWEKPSPRYLFLVGEASFDYRMYLEGGPTNVIPAPMVPVYYSGETVSDSQLGDVDGDHKPELSVGRWPVDDPKDVEALVERTLAYENGEVSDSSIFVADGSSQEFALFNSNIINESGFKTGKISQLIGSGDEDLIQSWNQGAWLVTYTGHGSLDRWGKQGVLDNAAVAGLEFSTAPPIVLQLTCLTGYFAHPQVQSLSETLLLEENGPVLVIAATSLTLSDNQRPFGINLLRQLLDPDVVRIGDAIVRAKTDLNVSDPNIREISDTFGLLGDPATIIVRPD